MSEVERMQCKSKFDTYLTRTDKTKMQLKQVFSNFYGWVDENTREIHKEDGNFEHVYNAKDVIALQKVPKTINSIIQRTKRLSEQCDRQPGILSLQDNIKVTTRNTMRTPKYSIMLCKSSTEAIMAVYLST